MYYPKSAEKAFFSLYYLHMAVQQTQARLMDTTNFNGCSIFSYPHAFVDRRNEPILIMPLNEKKFGQLHTMYSDCVPRNTFSGLPPIKDEACKKWIDNMIDNAVNLIAVSFERGVVGHTALFPMQNKRVEMIIVVMPQFQYRGIGTQLTQSAIQLAYEAGYEKVWLSVEMSNYVARHIYLKCGFEYINYGLEDELDMTFDLQRYRRVANIIVSEIMSDTIFSIHKNGTCKEAIDLLLKNPVEALPVIDNDKKIVGIISETDLIKEVNLNKKINTIMTREVLTICSTYTLDKIIRLCQSRKIRCFPVVDKENKLIGVINRKDILSYYDREL